MQLKPVQKFDQITSESPKNTAWLSIPVINNPIEIGIFNNYSMSARWI